MIFISSPSLINFSTIYLYQYEPRDIIYFIHWVIIQYSFILLLTLFQLWMLGALPVGSCASLTYPSQLDDVERGIRNQGLCAGCAHCYLGAI